MATAASKAASLTTLVIGNVKVPVALFSTVAKPGNTPQGFTTAGPNGGVLKAEMRARPVPVEELPSDLDEPVHGDPLAVDDSAGIGAPPTDLPPAMQEPWSPEHASVAEAAAAGDPVAIEARREALAAEAERAAGDLYDRFAAGLAAGASAQVDGEYGRVLVEEGSGVVVEPQDVRRGVRLEDGRFVDCTAQLAEIEERTKLETAQVLGFVDITRVPRATMKGAYYVGAGDEHAPRALRIIFEALKNKRRGAVVKITKRSRQSVGVIGWLDGVLVLYELVFSEDFRPPPARAARIGSEVVSSGEVAMFEALIDAMPMSSLEVADLRDDAIALREELHAKALAGEVPEVLVPEAVRPEDDLLRQLEASLAAVGS